MMPIAAAESTAFDKIGSGIEFVLNQTKTILDLVLSSEILSLGIAVWVVFAAVSLFKRLV